MSVISTSSIERAAGKYLSSAKAEKEFSLEDLASFVTAETKAKTEEDKEKISRELPLYLESTGEYFLSASLVFGKKAFFRNAEFRIVPTKVEVENGILISGARFAPFVNPEIFHDEFMLTDDKTECKVKTVSIRFIDVAAPFLFLGQGGMFDTLVAESEENRKVLSVASRAALEAAKVTLSVFDVEDFYRKNSFVNGDALIVTVRDWEKGIFSVRKAPKEADGDAFRKKQEEFLFNFEKAILAVCEESSNYFEIPEQIANAYFLAFIDGADLRSTPYLAMDEYKDAMREVGIKREGPDWVLAPADDFTDPGSDPVYASQEDGNKCSCGHDHNHHDHDDAESGNSIEAKNFSVSSGAIDSLEAILSEHGTAINYTEILSFIRDALANGEENFEDFRASMTDRLGIKFTDDAQETAFLNFLEDEWECAEEFFNPNAESGKSPLRTRLLELTERRIDLSSRLLKFYGKKSVPASVAEKFRRFHGDVLDTMKLIDNDDVIPEEDELSDLELRIGDLEEAIDSLEDDLENEMKKKAKK